MSANVPLDTLQGVRSCHLPIVALAVLCAGCGSHRTVKVPPVDTTNFGEALKRLHAAGLEAEVDSFVPLPAGYWLSGATVGDQDPEPGTRVPRGSVVRLNMHGSNVIPSPAVRIDRPRWATVPNLVGLSEAEAERRSTDAFWPAITRVDPLPADRSDEGLDAFVVASQNPKPGTRIPYTGRLVAGSGFRVSIVRLTLRLRPGP